MEAKRGSTASWKDTHHVEVEPGALIIEAAHEPREEVAGHIEAEGPTWNLSFNCITLVSKEESSSWLRRHWCRLESTPT
jgi:hypothetical protein